MDILDFKKKDIKISGALQKESNGISVYEFNSIYEICNLAEEKKNVTIYNGKLHSNCPKRGDFNFCESLDEAINLCRNGWDYAIEELDKPIKINHTKMTMKQEYNVYGGNASVPRYLQGIPTNMINSKFTPVKNKIITLTRDTSYACNVSVDKIIKDSVKFIQLIQKLESEGYRVNVFVYDALTFHSDVRVAHRGEGKNSLIVYRVKIKKSSERINLNKMSFCLCNPDFLRRLIFKMIELSSDFENSHENSYGVPVSQCQKLESEFNKFIKRKGEYLISPTVYENDIEKIILDVHSNKNRH